MSSMRSGLVEYKSLDATEPQRIGPDKVNEPPRCRDKNIDATRECAHLRAHGHAANGQRGVHGRVPTIGAKARENLARQLASRAQHEDPASLFFQPAVRREQTVQNGQRECGGLAGSGLGDADEIAAADQDGVPTSHKFGWRGPWVGVATRLRRTVGLRTKLARPFLRIIGAAWQSTG